MQAQTQQAPNATAEPKKYLEWEEGSNKVWLTGLKVLRGDESKPRTQIQLTFSEKSTAESFESPFTSVKLNLPLADDAQITKINMDRNIKAVLFPLAELKADAKTQISTLVGVIKEKLLSYDFLCDVVMKSTEGNSINSRTGAPNVFWNIQTLTPIEGQEKGQYDSAIDYDDIPF